MMRLHSVLGSAFVLVLAACGGAPEVTPPPVVPPPSIATTLQVAATPAGGAVGELPPKVRLAKPDGHLATVACLSFSPDGRHLVTGSDDRALLVWDLARGEIVQRLEGHPAYISRCSYLPDGRRIVSGGAWGEVVLWDALEGEILTRLRGLGIADDITSLAVRPDGREILIGAYTGKLMAWDVKQLGTGNEDVELGRDRNGRALVAGYLDGQRRFGGSGASLRIDGVEASYPLPFSAVGAAPLPGGRLVTAGGTGVYVSMPFEVPRLIGKHQGNVEAVAASGSREIAVAVDRYGLARVWGVEDGTARCDLKHGSALRAVALDASGAHFAVGAEDGVILVARTSDCIVLHRFASPRARIRAVAAGGAVVLGDGAGHVSTWSIGDWRGLGSTQAHIGEVTALALLPDGRWISGGLDSAVIAGPSSPQRKLAQLSWFPWRVQPKLDERAVLVVDESGRIVAVPLDGSASTDLAKNDGGLYTIALRPGKREAIFGGRSRVLYKLTGPAFGGARAIEWLRPGHSITALAYSPDGRFTVEGSNRGDIVVRDADTGASARPPAQVRTQVNGLVVTSDHVWAGSLGGELFQLPLQGDFSPTLALPEGSGMYDLARTADGRYLVAALDNGAAVHELPSGRRVASLIPLRDGSWASIQADRRFVASGGAALGLRVEDPESRRVATLGNLSAPVSIGAISTERLAAGPARVRAAVFSRSGPPRVRLDGRWPIAITPSPSSLPAYEVELLLADPTAGEHTLEVLPPEGAPARQAFRAPPAVGVGSARALLIGNQRYAHEKPPAGVADDARALADALRREDGWQLANLKPELDLKGAEMEGAVAAFFRDAAPGETLLFHFAGLGLVEHGESYLLPVDHDRAIASSRLSLSSLWSFIERSPAAQIVVVLDACRDGAFKIPAAIEKLAESKRTLFLTCGASSAQQGSLTRTLLDAMRDPARIDARLGAVTMRTAFVHAAGAAPLLRSGLFGDHALEDVILASPRDPASRTQAVAVAPAGAAMAAALADVDATLETRAGGEAGAFFVRARFAEDAESLRFTLLKLAGNETKPALQMLAPGGARYRKGQRITLRVPLRDALPSGCYRAELESCAKDAACGAGPAVRFELRLPDGGKCGARVAAP
ncbi:High-affnity carbon uptake protein Hat/HatR [Minicystis rosea]|nr:High-affnity carbon uptake protein Hat/HatR [Minicystis rosea]